MDPRFRGDDDTYRHSIPILGKNYQLIFREGRTKQVKTEDNTLLIFHPYDGHHKLLTLWLKQRALHFLADQSKQYAKLLQVKVQKVRVREVRSRWGSCSHKGNLSYSWRLIFAPLEVTQYVCAHEVAHLVHMNHSPAFWNTVALICENYKDHRNWLRSNGHTLFLYS